MTHLETQVLEKLKALPLDNQQEVLAFVEFLILRTAQSNGDRATHNDNAALPKATQSEPFSASEQLRDSIQVKGHSLSTSIASDRVEERY